jgi:hypothetical protein
MKEVLVFEPCSSGKARLRWDKITMDNVTERYDPPTLTIFPAFAFFLISAIVFFS